MLLRSEIFYSLFITALFNTTLLKSKQMIIFAQFISAGAIACHLESMGALTLENFLSFNQTNDFIQGTIKKKFKSYSELYNQLYKQIDHWLELAKCNRSIANYDNVRGIFSQKCQD
jgi:hypothetical protein